jgi:hypothetical protein
VSAAGPIDKPTASSFVSTCLSGANGGRVKPPALLPDREASNHPSPLRKRRGRSPRASSLRLPTPTRPLKREGCLSMIDPRILGAGGRHLALQLPLGAGIGSVDHERGGELTSRTILVEQTLFTPLAQARVALGCCRQHRTTSATRINCLLLVRPHMVWRCAALRGRLCAQSRRYHRPTRESNDTSELGTGLNLGWGHANTFVLSAPHKQPCERQLHKFPQCG